jgi:hypothetical protein
MEQYLTRIRKMLRHLVVSLAAPAGSQKRQLCGNMQLDTLYCRNMGEVDISSQENAYMVWDKMKSGGRIFYTLQNVYGEGFNIIQHIQETSLQNS